MSAKTLLSLTLFLFTLVNSRADGYDHGGFGSTQIAQALPLVSPAAPVTRIDVGQFICGGEGNRLL